MVDKESRSILSSLPARVSTNGDEIKITGDHNRITQSKKLLFGGPLLHLQFKSYTFKCKSTFMSPIKHYILKPFAAENKIQYYIDSNKHTDDDVSNDPEIDKFRVIIYSKDEYVFTRVCHEMEVITPKTQLFQPYCEEAIHFVRKAKKSFEDKYRVCIIIDDSIYKVTVYGLTLDEVQQCRKHIHDDVESNIETTKQIPLNRYECMYLEKKQGDKLKQSFSCELMFPQHREESVYIRGKIRDVKSVESRLSDLQSKLQVIKFNVQCKLLLINMWKMWWHDLIIEQQKKHDVIIQFDSDIDVKGTVEHERSIVQVAFEIIGTNMTLLRCIESTLHDEQTEERVIILEGLNKSAFMDVKKLPLFSMFPLALVDTNQWSGTITVVSPKSLSSNLDIAEEEILKFLELHADISKEITLEDPIFRLILASPTMSTYYVETIKDNIADSEKVAVYVCKQTNLKLKGNPSAVEKVESMIHTKFINEIESTLYSASSNHATLLATNQFLHIESELQSDYCVTLSYTKPKYSSKVLHSKEIKSPQFAHCLQLSICYGSIVYEEVDAIVNPTNEDLKHVSGIGKSIVVGGGAIIQYESNEYVQQNGKVATGTCVCLGAGELPSKKIIHTVWPEYHEESKEEQIIYDTVMQCLQCADMKRLKSVALPAIGTGIFGVSEEVCATASLRAVYDYCQSIVISNISAVKFVLHEPDMLKQFSLAFQSIFSSVTKESKTTSCILLWLWKNDDGSYTPYTPEVSADLTKEYETNPKGSLTRMIKKRTYVIDFSTMIQTNVSTGFQREIVLSPQADNVQWMYMDDHHCWSHYTSRDSQTIERMYQGDSTVPTKLTIKGNTYSFDFKQKVQINVKTNHKRKILRVEKRSLSEKHTQNEACSDGKVHEHHKLPNKKLTIQLRGLKSNLHEAKTRLHEKLTSLYTSSPPLSIPFAMKSNICQIAEQHNVIWSVVNEDSKCKGKKTMLKVTLSGLATDIKYVMTTVDREKSDYNDHGEYPEEWENISEGKTIELQLFQLKRGTNEWSCVEQKFTNTMPNSQIIQIIRIQNTCLWRDYIFEKKKMSERNNGEINEFDLFHGTRKTHPQKIYASQIGFDVRCSNNGIWGQANYFAEKASYSDDYAHTTSDGMKEIFLVKVLTGESCECPQNSKLRMPPIRSREDGSRLLEHYDTITGWTGRDYCKVYMTYDNDKAYPAYLIKYIN